MIDVRTRRHCAYCRLKKCFDVKMRKDWIRTQEEIELRRLKKLAKEQKKLNQLTADEQSHLDLPIVMRKKKRLMIKPTVQEWTMKQVNIDSVIKLIIILCLLDTYTNIFPF